MKVKPKKHLFTEVLLVQMLWLGSLGSNTLIY
jgi:hypothetical protein